MSISLSLVNGKCPGKCLFCPSKFITQPLQFITDETIQQIISHIDTHNVHITGFGEHTLHPNFIHISQLLLDRYENLTITTSLIGRWTDEKLEVLSKYRKITINFPGSNEMLYNTYKKGKFSTVVDNINRLLSKQKGEIRIRFLEGDEDELRSLFNKEIYIEFGRLAGFSKEFLTLTQIGDPDKIQHLNIDKATYEVDKFFHCPVDVRWIIGYDGYIYRCPFMVNTDFRICHVTEINGNYKEIIPQKIKHMEKNKKFLRICNFCGL